jgi:DNA repair protein RecO (recombination protein O)
MRARHDDAYVLDTHPLGDSDRIVTLLAAEAGLVRGVAPSARRSRRRFGGALEPLTQVRATWMEKQGRDLHRLESLEIVRSHAAMQAEPSIQAACAVMAEVARAVSREDQPDPKTFRLLGALLHALAAGLGPWPAVRYFEYWTLRLHGMLPDPLACAGCATPLTDEDGGWACPGEGVLCSGCRRAASLGGRRLDRADRALLADAGSRPPSAMASHAAAARPGGAVEVLLRGGLEIFAERGFRSYRHLGAATTSRTA